MSYSLFDFLKLVGSLGLFLYGMKIMSEGLQKMAGDKLRGILSSMTKNRFMGVMTGIIVTALIQSSSATTVMVVSFVNAGLLSLLQSIGVIMGANVGTTVTAWVISLFGFGSFSISALSIPLMGVALPFIFSSKNKNKSLGEFFFGFAFLFMGLDFLKDSMPDLQNNPEVLSFVQNFSNMGMWSTFIFLLIGTVLTIIVQSSSATLALTLIMATKGWIDFPSAAAMILGENIGTTITTNLAAIPANISAKRAAFSHMLFNVFGVIWMLFVFKFFVNMVDNIMFNASSVRPTGVYEFINSMSSEDLKAITTLPKSELSADLVAKQSLYNQYQMVTSYGLSLYHTMFNILNVMLMVWFVKYYEKLSLLIIRPKKGEDEDEEFVLKHIDNSRLASTSELSILQAEKEMEVYAQRTRKMFGFVVKMTNMDHNDKKFMKLYNRTEKYEDICDRMELEIANYLGKVLEGRLSSRSKEHVRDILRAVTEIESMADASCNIARHLKRKMDANEVLDEKQIDNINDMYKLVEKSYDNMQTILKVPRISSREVIESQNLEKMINTKRDTFKRQNVDSINNDEYSYQSSVFYMDIISECEKLGDYMINVVEALSNFKMMKKM